MPFRYLPDIALADIAFEATGVSLPGLFEAAAAALTEVMVDRKSVTARKSRPIHLVAEDTERLLYDFLTELIVIKDVELFLAKAAEVRIDAAGRRLDAKLAGQVIDRKRNKLRNDVKAVTMHMFGIRKEGKTWKATIVLDI